MGADDRRQRLTDDAHSFAARLTRLLNGTVTRGVRVRAIVKDEGRRATVAPVPSDLRKSIDKRIGLAPLSLATDAAARAKAALWLRLQFQVGLDNEDEHLQVNESAFALVVNYKTGAGPIRVEYDRRKTSKQQSHVQIVGESESLGYALALAGQPLKPLSKLHLPTGGRRFRPALEDFIEFLAQEDLLPAVHQGWKNVIAASRADWEALQTQAAVRRMPEAAIEQLEAMGYEVTPQPP